mmetsp:Transcript_4505/g.7885  ORF Transcript_4505/g.7885 Transcript_4505/m.7885 type:complete len:98 (-) Transcript_4505:235-528(-)
MHIPALIRCYKHCCVMGALGQAHVSKNQLQICASITNLCLNKQICASTNKSVPQQTNLCLCLNEQPSKVPLLTGNKKVTTKKHNVIKKSVHASKIWI